MSPLPKVTGLIISDLAKKYLPAWATIGSDRDGERIVVESEVVYPLFLGILGYSPTAPTQAELECCRRCLTEYLKREVFKKFDGDDAQFALQITAKPEKKWALRNFTEGKPILWESEYKRIKGQIK